MRMSWLKRLVCKYVNGQHLPGRKFRMKTGDKQHSYFTACTYCGKVISAPAPVARKARVAL